MCVHDMHVRKCVCFIIIAYIQKENFLYKLMHAIMHLHMCVVDADLF